MTLRFGSFALLLAGALAFAQPPAGGQKPAADAAKPDKDKDKPKDLDPQIDEGIPVTSVLVKKSCGACHRSDDKGRMSRISFRRTTPEGWQQSIKRMVSLNGVKVSPEDARQIVRYLSNNHGLAPEEFKAGAFEVEKRLIDYKYAADADTERTCIQCHSFGRVLLQRRTKQEWEWLMAMHRGYYPLVDFQAFRRMGPPQTQPGPDGRPPDNRHPMDKALAHLSGAFPMKTAEWATWSANLSSPKLEGAWAVSGYEVGKGAFFGTVTIRRNDSSKEGDEFLTEAKYVYARGGQTVTRSGKSIVYTGFQWRGRSSESGKDEMREVMTLERNRREMSGRWFNGGYEERGLDVKLTRLGADPVVLGMSPTALKTGSDSVLVEIFGANLASTANALSLGKGVALKRVVSVAPDRLKLEVSVAADAPIGARDLVAGGATVEKAAVVYDKIDGIKVRPKWGMARVGGVVFPKQYQQFEAAAYNNGPDGKPDTADDLDLGLVDVTWSLEEYAATYNDDDLQFVGRIDQKGLFTPNVDGPNPQRSGNRNNIGDVWVVAVYAPGGDKKPIRARAHLLVAPPVYMRFDQPEVSQ